jgi:hypothetical protein
VGILRVEQKTNILASKILASKRPSAPVKTRYEWQLLNCVSGWGKVFGTCYLRKLTVAVTGLGVPIRKLLDYCDIVWLVKSTLLQLRNEQNAECT